MKEKYSSLNDLIKNNLDTLETAEALTLIKKLKDVKTKRFLTKKQFYKVAMWKSPRPKKHYLSNSEELINRISNEVLSTDSEEIKIALLTSLNGVSIPVASSLLTIIDPKNYGIIDIRVWQLLYLYGEIKTKPYGQGFNFSDWKIYLSILRKYASNFKINVRDIERIFFFHHRETQVGKLYQKKN